MRSTWGSIRQRGNVWEIRFTVAGKPKCEYVSGTRNDAERRRAELRVQYEGMEPDMTLDQFWTRYYHPEAEENLALSTLREYERQYDADIKPIFGDVPLREISSRDVQKMIDTMTKGKAKHVKAGLSAILSRAFAMELVDDNVAMRRFVYPKTKAPRQRTKEIYTIDEMNEIFERCAGEVWEAIYILAAFGGALRSEAMSPKLSEIELIDGFVVIPVQRSVQRIDGEVKVLESPKNEYRADDIIIAPPYADRLWEIAQEGLNRGDVWLTDDGFGWPNCPERVVKAYERWFQRQPLRYIPFGNLRNAYSTYMHKLNLEDSTVSKLMRHADLRTDYRHYNRLSTADKIEQLSDALGIAGQDGDHAQNSRV